MLKFSRIKMVNNLKHKTHTRICGHTNFILVCSTERNTYRTRTRANMKTLYSRKK